MAEEIEDAHDDERKPWAEQLKRMIPSDTGCCKCGYRSVIVLEEVTICENFACSRWSTD